MFICLFCILALETRDPTCSARVCPVFIPSPLPPSRVSAVLSCVTEMHVPFLFLHCLVESKWNILVLHTSCLLRPTFLFYFIVLFVRICHRHKVQFHIIGFQASMFFHASLLIFIELKHNLQKYLFNIRPEGWIVAAATVFMSTQKPLQYYPLYLVIRVVFRFFPNEVCVFYCFL
jgi:hypothetical protein